MKLEFPLIGKFSVVFRKSVRRLSFWVNYGMTNNPSFSMGTKVVRGGRGGGKRFKVVQIWEWTDNSVVHRYTP